MNLDLHVCALELAQKLLTLGVNQNSLFYWTTGGVVYRGEMPFYLNTNYSAFIATELLNILPYYIDTKTDEPFNNFRLSITKFIIFDQDKKEMAVNYLINYLCDTTETGGESAWLQHKLFSTPIYDTNLANAAAKVLIYLIESGLITTPLPGALQDG